MSREYVLSEEADACVTILQNHFGVDENFKVIRKLIALGMFLYKNDVTQIKVGDKILLLKD